MYSIPRVTKQGFLPRILEARRSTSSSRVINVLFQGHLLLGEGNSGCRLSLSRGCGRQGLSSPAAHSTDKSGCCSPPRRVSLPAQKMGSLPTKSIPPTEIIFSGLGGGIHGRLPSVSIWGSVESTFPFENQGASASPSATGGGWQIHALYAAWDFRFLEEAGLRIVRCPRTFTHSLTNLQPTGDKLSWCASGSSTACLQALHRSK